MAQLFASRRQITLSITLLCSLATCGSLTGCGENSEPPEFTDDFFQGRTVLFVPDEATGGVAEWYYDFDVSGVDVSGGTAADVSRLTGCNVERSYEATAWDFDNETDLITVEFGGEWERYELTDVKTVDEPRTGRFAMENSVGLTMEGDWFLRFERESNGESSGPSISAACAIFFDNGTFDSSTWTHSYCDCLHCISSSCDLTSSNGSCCTDAYFYNYFLD